MSRAAYDAGYDLYNRLTSAGSATFAYDPAGRLYKTEVSSIGTRFQYDGLDLIAEYDDSDDLLRRYVHGPSFDEPVVWYEGDDTADRRWLMQDQLGSIIAVTDSDGNAIAINSYDEYGRPAATNQGRFQYTGQTWIAEATLYHYKARAYSPILGRFMQTDPIVYAGGMNLYAYAEDQPTSRLDPTGQFSCVSQPPDSDGGGGGNGSWRCQGIPGSPNGPGMTGIVVTFGRGGSGQAIVVVGRKREKATDSGFLHGVCVAALAAGGAGLGSLVGAGEAPIIGGVTGALVGLQISRANGGGPLGDAIGVMLGFSGGFATGLAVGAPVGTVSGGIIGAGLGEEVC